MLYAVLVDDDSKSMFLPDADDIEVGEDDIFVGLVDDETDTACGVLGAQPVSDGEDHIAITITFIRIAPGYEDRGGEKILINMLLDVAGALGCSAVHCAGQFLNDTDDNNEALLSELGFYPEEEKVSIYTFSVEDVKANDPESDLACVKLSDLKHEQWEDFVEETTDYDFFLLEPELYEKDLSIFLTDDNKKVQAGVLLSVDGKVLFVDAIAAYGRDQKLLINDLIRWSSDGAKKRLPGDTQVDIFLPSSRAYRDILMAATDKRAKKVGNLMTYTYETPVSF